MKCRSYVEHFLLNNLEFQLIRYYFDASKAKSISHTYRFLNQYKREIS